MIRVDGREYGTAAQIAARLGPDITEHMIRNWAARDGLTRHRAGGSVYYPLDDATRIEADKGHSGRGRGRRVDAPALTAA